jgi:hypothetical protein
MVGVPAFLWWDWGPSDEPRPQRQAQEQRRHAGQGSAKRDVTEQPEADDTRIELFVKKPVEH